MTKTVQSWQVRQVEDSPTSILEGFTLYRVLEDSQMSGIGCEFVTINSGEVLQPHVHKIAHSIILVISGNGYVLLDGVKYPIKKRSMINIPPGVVHGLESTNEDLVVYGFQSPAIIKDNTNVDIFFTEDKRQGTIA